MEEGIIQDAQLHASSIASDLESAKFGRLNNQSYWKAGVNNEMQWFQVGVS